MMGAAVVSGQPALQQPTFQSGVDLLQVDVSVLDPAGRPIPDQGVSDFSVAVDGEPRRVLKHGVGDRDEGDSGLRHGHRCQQQDAEQRGTGSPRNTHVPSFTLWRKSVGRDGMG
jgi:hypothetical protein